MKSTQSTPLARTERVSVETKIGKVVFRSKDGGDSFTVSAKGKVKIHIFQVRYLQSGKPASKDWFAGIGRRSCTVATASSPEKAFKKAVKHYWK